MFVHGEWMSDCMGKFVIMADAGANGRRHSRCDFIFNMAIF